MIETITLTGYWIWAILIYFGIDFLFQLRRVLSPNAYIKDVIAGKSKLHDNFTRFCGVFGVAFSLFVIFYILGYIS